MKSWTKKHAAGDYSLLADKTTEIADKAVLSIFIRYLNSDTHKVKEEYLGLAEITGSKCADSVKKFVNYYTRRILSSNNFASMA